MPGSGVGGRNILRVRGDRGPGAVPGGNPGTSQAMRRWARRRRRQRRICLSRTEAEGPTRARRDRLSGRSQR